MGDYCSYCERRLETNLAVEHKQPKALVPALENEWTNFLLGCVNCNSAKGDTPIALIDYLWPDTDNTISVFSYTNGGLIRPNAGLTPALQSKASETLRLVGLDRYPGNPGREPTFADLRWERRFKIWQKAEYCRKLIDENDTDQVRHAVVEVAKESGMYSIFWTVFGGDQDMRKRLREAFIGTSFVCFDPNENPLARPGGQV